MTKKVVVLQEDKNDCAAACVSSLIKYYNGIDYDPISKFNQYNFNSSEILTIYNQYKKYRKVNEIYVIIS